MSRYLQTSTSNPYGHRPWATRLYTGFENYGFLKQPQNTILRGDPAMRPEIYKPPELKPDGLGDVTIVGGSGKILRRGRQRTLGLILANGGSTLLRSPIVPVYERPAPIVYMRPPAPTPIAAPLPIRALPTPPAPIPITPIPIVKPLPPITIYPPSLVPPPPTVVSSGPGGIVYALPGDATTPGSPFAPPPPGQLPMPSGSVPVSSSAAAAVASDPTIAAPSRSFSDWFNATDYFSSVPNGYLAIGAGVAVYFFAKKKR